MIFSSFISSLLLIHPSHLIPFFISSVFLTNLSPLLLCPPCLDSSSSHYKLYPLPCFPSFSLSPVPLTAHLFCLSHQSILFALRLCPHTRLDVSSEGVIRSVGAVWVGFCSEWTVGLESGGFGTLCLSEV